MIPRLSTLDSTASFLLDGYAFGSRRFARLKTNAFRTRLMFKPAVLLRGADASRLFYEGGRFTRSGALPNSVLLEAMRGESAERLTSIFRDEWNRAAIEWGTRDSIELHTALWPVLTRTAAVWAGVPLAEDEVGERAEELAAMLENAALVGPPNWAARAQGRRTEAWARDIVRRVRSGEITPGAGTPLRLIADHVDEHGVALDEAGAAVELINVLRPVVAVGRYIVFAALALHRHPKWARAFAAGDDADLDHFADEVRRFYPFFPVVGGRATESFEWEGHRFEPGDLVLLDLYGTNHDEAIWSEPHRFRPERFRDWDGDRNTLIPQGGGDAEHGHRAPGEQLTIELVKEAVRLLSRRLVYSVPDQDLRISLRRIPAIPESRFIMRVAADRG